MGLIKDNKINFISKPKLFKFAYMAVELIKKKDGQLWRVTNPNADEESKHLLFIQNDYNFSHQT